MPACECHGGRGRLQCLRAVSPLHAGTAPAGNCLWASLPHAALPPVGTTPAGAAHPLQAGCLRRQPVSVACLAAS
ncbi:unnamed protein product, partial [Musa textilis]